MSELSRREYESLLQIAEVALVAQQPHEWWQITGELSLEVLFRADVFSIAEIDHRTIKGRFGAIQPAWAEAAVPTGSPMHHALLTDHPFTAHLTGRHGTDIVRITDLISPLTWRNTAGHAKMRELINATNQLSIPITLNPLRSLSMSPIRAGSDFTDHEVLVARRLRPLLRAADQHGRAMTSQMDRLSDEERRQATEAAADSKLTPRERVVLGLMAQGRSAQEISNNLSISQRTVSKHQEKIYRKLKVPDRLSAVLRGQQVGILKAPVFKSSTTDRGFR